MMIDLGKMRDKFDDCCDAGPKKPRKQEKYYPTSYIDDVGDIDIDDLPMDKDIEIKAVIRIKSATKRIHKDGKDNKDSKTNVDLNYEMRSIDFNPSKTSSKTSHNAESVKDGESMQNEIEEALS